eukprot:TRINITY_DN887_c1_g4_i1.p1 TRINITY_DN887_c1_g4~~TRINITY_DN887_c1_g4_i1.p1  ORF type:complete len:148 (+),score=2.21 TRINITY_DN887_c1_g4_i1:659-1102(+)
MVRALAFFSSPSEKREKGTERNIACHSTPTSTISSAACNHTVLWPLLLPPPPPCTIYVKKQKDTRTRTHTHIPKEVKVVFFYPSVSICKRKALHVAAREGSPPAPLPLLFPSAFFILFFYDEQRHLLLQLSKRKGILGMAAHGSQDM